MGHDAKVNALHAHRFDLTPAAARELQKSLSGKVVREDRFETPRTIAGVDMGLPRGGKHARAAVVVLTWPGLEELARSVVVEPLKFPYVPGLLSFRELPAVLSALDGLDTLPDMVLCDGQGIAHPRRFGLASHLGVLIDRPTVGVAKTRFIGEYDDPGPDKGDRTPLMDGEERIGYVLRTRSRVKPLFVSTGHRVSAETACEIVLGCCTRYRLPETTRRADALASERGWL